MSVALLSSWPSALLLLALRPMLRLVAATAATILRLLEVTGSFSCELCPLFEKKPKMSMTAGMVAGLTCRASLFDGG